MVISQINQVNSYIEEHNSKLSRVIGLTRKDKTDYPKIAICEALINAEVHRMYNNGNAVIIRVFKVRMTISSPPENIMILGSICGSTWMYVRK